MSLLVLTTVSATLGVRVSLSRILGLVDVDVDIFESWEWDRDTERDSPHFCRTYSRDFSTINVGVSRD